MKFETYRIAPATKIKLKNYPTIEKTDLSKETGRKQFKILQKKLIELHELLYVENQRSLLIVLQAPDTGGKDSTIRQIFSGLDPSGCYVANFKAPSALERSHDFLWRIHQQVPERGHIGIFNRSHYEDVLIARVKNLVPKKQWEKRYHHINAFEAMLHDEGVTILKFYLHISKDYQKERLQKRLSDPHKYWKFSMDDITERAFWEDYQIAYEEVFNRCSTEDAPWYVIPGEQRWLRDLIITSIIVDTLQKFKMKLPKPDFDPKKIILR